MRLGPRRAVLVKFPRRLLEVLDAEVRQRNAGRGYRAYSRTELIFELLGDALGVDRRGERLKGGRR